jgi:hypothetical protein
MSRRKGPLFLARRSYRLRRMRDAARLLPLLGGFLVFLPVLWQPAATSTRDTAADGVYLFAVWAVLIVVAALMARGLGDTAEDEPMGAEDDA